MVYCAFVYSLLPFCAEYVSCFPFHCIAVSATFFTCHLYISCTSCTAAVDDKVPPAGSIGEPPEASHTQSDEMSVIDGVIATHENPPIVITSNYYHASEYGFKYGFKFFIPDCGPSGPRPITPPSPSLSPRPKQPQRGSLAVSRAGK